MCSSRHLGVTEAAADRSVDSHTLATVLPLNPYGVILQHADARRPSRHRTQQHAFQQQN